VYDVSAQGGATVITYAAELVTTTTSLTIPPALLTSGQAYGFTITAFSSPIDATTKPFHWSPVVASADVMTALVTP
jgi:hypothetical protein